MHTSRQKNLFRDYYLCGVCDLVFVPPEFHLEPAAERDRYLAHNNDSEDLGYRRFLARLWNELKPRLSPGASGLDFGAGPGPVLVEMMREDGFDVALYDPFFAPDEGVLESRYDFITCTETAEHFANPRHELERLKRILKPGGWLGGMTGMLPAGTDFPEWHYHGDVTHLCFYSRKSMEWMASHQGWNVLFPRENVVLFQDRGSSPRKGAGC